MTPKLKLESILEKASKEAPPVDWKLKLNRWQHEIKELYTMIEEWLGPSIKKGYVHVTRELTSPQLQEEYVGSYSTENLICKVGGKRIEFRPKGMFIIGARGRVDIFGPRDGQPVMLLLLGEDEEPSVQVTLSNKMPEPGQNRGTQEPQAEPKKFVWKMAVKSGRLTTRPLTEELFADIFAQFLN